MVETRTIEKLEKTLPRLSSNFDGEVVATARAVERIMQKAGVEWPDVLIHPGPSSPCQPPPSQGGSGTMYERGDMSRIPDLETLNDMVQTVLVYGLYVDRREQRFVQEMERLVRQGRYPSAKQYHWLRNIYSR